MRALLALTVLVSAACLHTLGPGVSGVVDAGAGTDTLELTYTGTGGWLIRHGSDVVMAAPLFSNPGFVETGLTPIAADTALIDEHMSRYQAADTRAILVGHGHYDHLMDVPRIVAKHAPRARVVGSETVANLLGTWSGIGDRVDLIEPNAGNVAEPGKWMSYGPGVRIMPLESFHAPHFDGYTLYHGSADVPRDAPPPRAEDWVDGQTVAFLVDFLGPAGEVSFRVYYQDAVVAPPYGFAPDALIAERPVDAAIVVPATFDQVDWHPEALVENLKPLWVLLGHWENFFLPVDAPTRSVMMSDLGHFEDRLSHVFDGEFFRPEIGTVFRLAR